MPSHDLAEVLTSPLLARHGVPHCFSTRRGGVSRPPFDSLNFGNPGDLPAERKDPKANIMENWRRVLDVIGCAGRRVVEVHQVHGGEVVKKRRRDEVAKALDVSEKDPKADAIVTDDAACVATVRVADCVPVLMAGADGRVVAAVHAGWRGVVAGVAVNALLAMREMGVGDCVAAIGPCIGYEHFEVGEEVASEFRRVFGARAPIRGGAGGKSYVDLQAAIELQLKAEGVREIEVLRRCTVSEPEHFFSHRRDRGVTGRMAGIIGVRTW